MAPADPPSQRAMRAPTTGFEPPSSDFSPATTIKPMSLCPSSLEAFEWSTSTLCRVLCPHRGVVKKDIGSLPEKEEWSGCLPEKEDIGYLPEKEEWSGSLPEKEDIGSLSEKEEYSGSLPEEGRR
ncbi:hypothetical protein M5K25_019621 [Dendrobium thyrsiflorum]|uniref:Uncharacterized protein n=1 Tax=Dendrobium thyrsiflorum TaxID=117978 RepID=A0ABD0UFE7_DENTH